MAQERRCRSEHRRDRVVAMRFSEDEIAEINRAAEACGFARSAWIAKTVGASARDDITPLEAVPYQEVGKVRRELVAQGNNLNQIALHLTRSHSISTAGVRPR